MNDFYTKLPLATKHVTLRPVFFDSYPECFGIEIQAYVNSKDTPIIWDSGLYDTHPDEVEWSYEKLREEAEAAFDHYGWDVSEIKNYSKNCVIDWEWTKQLIEEMPYIFDED